VRSSRPGECEEATVASYTSKTDMVAAVLRELILTGELPPGSSLRQRDLAKRLEVSPTPVREALRRLESEGLIRCDVHRGSTVVEAEQGLTDENYQIRAALESLGASLAAGRITDSEIAVLEGLNDQLVRLPDKQVERYAELNLRFHFSIYESSRSPVLLSLVRLLWQQMHGGPRVLRSHRASAEQHAHLIAALRAHDGERAAEITREHILSATHCAIATPEAGARRRVPPTPVPRSRPEARATG
jgi:DNA-binding GntR family transcriptional regulator